MVIKSDLLEYEGWMLPTQPIHLMDDYGLPLCGVECPPGCGLVQCNVDFATCPNCKYLALHSPEKRGLND